MTEYASRSADRTGEISRRYQDAAHFQPLPPDPDPLERLAPAIELSDPSIAQVRHAVTSIGAGQVPVTALEDVEIGAGEAEAKRHCAHGRE